MSRLAIRGLHAEGVAVTELAIESGCCTALSGPSGSGKTRLLRAIADLDPSSGDIRLDGVARETWSGPEWRRRVIYVAAESHWWYPRVGDHAGAWRDADLAELGFDATVLDWEVQRLSSGERQRLALARALAHAPEALLLDEPTANLDQDNGSRVERLVAQWREATGGCVLWVSHDAAQRARVASETLFIDAGRVPAPAPSSAAADRAAASTKAS